MMEIKIRVGKITATVDTENSVILTYSAKVNGEVVDFSTTSRVLCPGDELYISIPGDGSE